MRPSQQRFLLLSLIAALTLLLTFQGPTLWFWATHSRTYETFDGDFAGTFTRSRITGDRDGRTMTWSISTGFLVTSAWETESVERLTSWTPTGEVSAQEWYEPGISRTQQSPPWWWGVTDQESPSAPWLLEGVTFEEWWARVR